MAQPYRGPGCPRCDAPLAVAAMIAGAQLCPACGGFFEATPLSPPVRRAAVAALAEAGPAGGVPCARHAGNAAIAHCSRCGIFMCGLCRVQIDGQELCPACFDRLTAEGALPSARSRVRNYRGLALLAGLGGCWFYVLGLLTGPLTLYLAIQAARQRRRLEESDGLATVVIAFLLGILQIAGCLFFIATMITSIARSGAR
jgi:hypothetical protein